MKRELSDIKGLISSQKSQGKTTTPTTITAVEASDEESSVEPWMRWHSCRNKYDSTVLNADKDNIITAYVYESALLKYADVLYISILIHIAERGTGKEVRLAGNYYHATSPHINGLRKPSWRAMRTKELDRPTVYLVRVLELCKSK